MAENKVDLSFSNGWLHGRLAAPDFSSGAVDVGPGLDFSIRLEEVVLYHVAEPGVLAIAIAATGGFFQVIGSLETLRGIMAREKIREAE